MNNSNSLLEDGVKAPNFTLLDQSENRISLSDFRDKNVVLVFYPADFSPVCGDEVTIFNETLFEFQKYNAQVLGISVDSIWSHKAFAKEKNLRFPLLADFNPKGDVSKQYHAYSEEEGNSKRALFLIDQNGTITWNYLSPGKVNPGVNGILEALKNLK
jgi:peroxiredoxin